LTPGGRLPETRYGAGFIDCEEERLKIPSIGVIRAPDDLKPA
jgi:hypothetical protein